MINEPIRYESIHEPLDDEEGQLMDPGNWDWDNPIEGHTIGDPGTILRIRFTFDEVDALFQAARARGVPTEALVRDLAVAALHATRK